MFLKNWTRVLGTVVVLAAPAVLAADVKLNCPAGTAQKGGKESKFDFVACAKVEGGRTHGPMVLLYPSGAKQAEGQTENGFRTGVWTFYDEAGNKTGNATFKGGNFHGDVVELHANGQVRKQEKYVDGLREGTAEEFSADGKLVKKTQWRNNREVASR